MEGIFSGHSRYLTPIGIPLKDPKEMTTTGYPWIPGILYSLVICFELEAPCFGIFWDQAKSFAKEHCFLEGALAAPCTSTSWDEMACSSFVKLFGVETETTKNRHNERRSHEG